MLEVPIRRGREVAVVLALNLQNEAEPLGTVLSLPPPGMDFPSVLQCLVRQAQGEPLFSQITPHAPALLKEISWESIPPAGGKFFSTGIQPTRCCQSRLFPNAGQTRALFLCSHLFPFVINAELNRRRGRGKITCFRYIRLDDRAYFGTPGNFMLLEEGESEARRDFEIGHRSIDANPRCYGFRRPIESKLVLDVLDERLVILPAITACLMQTFNSNLLSSVVPVDSIIGICRTITVDLSADTGVMSPKTLGNFSQAELRQLQVADDISLFFCKMGVGHGGLLSGCAAE